MRRHLSVALLLGGLAIGQGACAQRETRRRKRSAGNWCAILSFTDAPSRMLETR